MQCASILSLTKSIFISQDKTCICNRAFMEKHSVDSVASYSSQNHVDHIRTKNQPTYSKCPEEIETKKKHSKFKQQRSLSNLELTFSKRPDSVVSNGSSTRKCIRGLVDGKFKSSNKSKDLEYLDNPAENLEFNRSQKEEAFKKRKLTRTSKEENLYQNPSEHKAKHTKREDYYANITKLPQDEFYQHLTRSKASEALVGAPDAEFHSKRCKHKDVEGTNLRRSRSLAVIREETFTELQVQPHAKNKRSQLIPRARLFDKPGFKERTPSRTINNTKEEVYDKTYSKAANTNYDTIENHPENKALNRDNSEERQENKGVSIPRGNRSCKSVGGSWPNLSDNGTKLYQLSEDSINLSHNPSEIDSLDSNYVRKHYNFEANRASSAYKESSSETTDHEALSPLTVAKQLFIFDDDTDTHNKSKSEINLPSYFQEGKYDTDRSTTNDSESNPRSDLSHFTYSQNTNIDDDKHNYEIVNVKNNCEINKPVINTQTITKSKPALVNQRSTSSSGTYIKHDDCFTSPSDSLTSYTSSSPLSIEKSRKLENLANSLAEKIDEYCDAKFKENFIEIPLSTSCGTNNSNFKTYEDFNCIYTQVKKEPILTLTSEKTTDYCERYQKNPQQSENQLYRQYYSKIKNNAFITDDLKTRSLYRQCGSTKNISTEPFITTLLENQYYSLPDINISKSLRRSEKIDEKLREEDRDDEPYVNAFNRIYNKLTNKTTNKKIANESPNQDSCHIEEEGNNSTEQLYDSVEQIIGEINIQTQEASNEGINNYFESKSNLENTPPKEEHKEKNNNWCKEASPIYQEVQERQNNYKDKEVQHQTPVIKVKRSHSYERAQDNTFTPKDKLAKTKTRITKHYSLRQRNPLLCEKYVTPPPERTQLDKTLINKTERNTDTKPETNISPVIETLVSNCKTSVTILPLSGHQTIIIDPPTENLDEIEKSTNLKELTTTTTINNINFVKNNSEIIRSPIDQSVTVVIKDKKDIHRDRYENSIAPKASKLRKDRSPKIAAVQHKFERPPPRLIIRDTKSLPVINLKTLSNMSRPQILNIIDNKKSQNKTNENENSKRNSTCSDTSDLISMVVVEDLNGNNEIKTNENTITGRLFNAADKLNIAVKTDIEYQEKLHSVKNYWSKLIDKTNDADEELSSTDSKNPEIHAEKISKFKPILAQNEIVSTSDEGISKIMESVKIVDIIKKTESNAALQEIFLSNNEKEKVKDEREVEQKTTVKIVKDSAELLENACSTIKQIIIPDTNENIKKGGKTKNEITRNSPEIEIVQLTTDNGSNQKEVKHATLIKSKSYNQDNADFDHVRYKVMKSDLFRKSMIGHYKREAQFDGLLQYLQDYSFQELLVNNNIVIIEPVRTSVDSTKGLNTSFKRPNSCRIATTAKKIDDKAENNKKAGLRRHFFYHPIRINKEIIEEELPNPDTVKKVRNLFEDTLKLRRPDNSSDPGLVDESIGNLSRRSLSYRNLTDDTKLHKHSPSKNGMRYLTIDTSYGNKKWDNTSLSSGVSSGDVSSSNDHDYEGDALSPFSNKVNRDNVYSSSSEEYLYESLNNNLCYESQYVSQDILKKIRDCGTSITYYGGKVLDQKYAPAVSPMTKAIMDEIRGLQKNCVRDCESCIKNCKDKHCSCLHSENIENTFETTIKNKSTNINMSSSLVDNKTDSILKNLDETKNPDNYSGFKFKLVKSNSCSSRLELTGADPRLKYRNKERHNDSTSLRYNGDNSVKTKICRIESYKKGTANTPFENNNIDNIKTKEIIKNNNKKEIFTKNFQDIVIDNSSSKLYKIGEKVKLSRNKNVDLAFKDDTMVNTNNQLKNDDIKNDKMSENDNRNQIINVNDISPNNDEKEISDTDKKKTPTEPLKFEKKYYYVNDEGVSTNGISQGKFGEMIFEEFEVLESCYDSLNSMKSGAN